MRYKRFFYLAVGALARVDAVSAEASTALDMAKNLGDSFLVPSGCAIAFHFMLHPFLFFSSRLSPH